VLVSDIIMLLTSIITWIAAYAIVDGVTRESPWSLALLERFAREPGVALSAEDGPVNI
jgi:hypothetical protein